MLSDIYNKRILELAGNIPRLGRLAGPDGTATAHSKLCGSTVTVDLKLMDGVVSDFAHDVKACALGQASSSIMARNIIGATPDDLRALRETVRRMLKDNGPPPGGGWSDVGVLEPVREYKARHASTLLTFEAVVDALAQAETHGKQVGSGHRMTKRSIAGFAAHTVIRGYQLSVSGLIGRQCRYLPTCSDYMDEAISRHGLWHGTWLGAARLCRCHPWGGAGFDPVPRDLVRNAVWYRPWASAQWRSPPESQD